MRETYNYKKQGEQTRRVIGRIINIEKVLAPIKQDQLKIVTTKIKLIFYVNNPRQFWKNIKEVIPKSKSKITSSAPFIKDYSVSDNDESQQKRKANIFCTFFSFVANNLKCKTIKLCNFTWRKLKSNLIRTTSKFKFRLVNKFWVKNQLRLLKRSKATGPDNLPPEMLKDCSNELSGPLCYLINFSISVTIPNEWKLAKVILIFKYEDSTDPNNYRPISILPILSKILE